MNIEQIKEKLKSEEYDFLRTDPHLGNNIILLGLGGSHAYGTNIETSDLDVRGCAINSKIEILTNVNFEQCCNEATDTTIYSLNKLIHLLSNCNPNCLSLHCDMDTMCCISGGIAEAYYKTTGLDNKKILKTYLPSYLYKCIEDIVEKEEKTDDCK